MKIRVDFRPYKAALLQDCGNRWAAGPKVRIVDKSTRRRKGSHEALHEADGKLAGVGGLFDTSCLDVRYRPYIAGVLAEGIAA